MSRSDLGTSVTGTCQCNETKRTAQGDAGQEPAATELVTETYPNGVALTIDVSNLPPPLPMVRILETLRDLGPSETLLVHHTRRPIHLYPKLEALGCTHETTEQPNGTVAVRITNPPAASS
jgi:TusA-related sulfurtransferase